MGFFDWPAIPSQYAGKAQHEGKRFDNSADGILGRAAFRHLTAFGFSLLNRRHNDTGRTPSAANNI
jgi:hypothetical protein